MGLPSHALPAHSTKGGNDASKMSNIHGIAKRFLFSAPMKEKTR